MTLSVPNVHLDTTLKQISANISYLDYRIIQAEDVAFQMLSNNLAQTRSAKIENRLSNAIDKKGKKLSEVAAAEDVLLSKQEENDNAKMLNFSLTDKVAFSTIHVLIYQKQTITRELVANEKNIDKYEPAFGNKIMESVKYGWSMLEATLVFLIKLWGLFLLLIFMYFIYKWYIPKFK